MRNAIFSWVVFLCFNSFAVAGDAPTTKDPLKKDPLEDALKNGGLTAMIHGAVHEQGLYVITYRKPGQINGIEFPLVTRDAGIQDQFKKLRRNDIVRVHGRFLDNGAPQRHILVTQLEVPKPWNPGAEPPLVRPSAEIPKDLMGKNVLVGKVHVAAGGGSILVVDYEGAVLPVFVEAPELTKDLWPNDKIRLYYEIRTAPKRPSHLALDLKAKKPIEVLDAQIDHTGKNEVLTGSLVLFPKSVLTTMETFAVETIDSDGIKQYHFIFAADMDTIREAYVKVRQIWESDTKGRVTYRSRYVNRNLKIEVKGEIFSSPLAGNPQILVTGPADVTAK